MTRPDLILFGAGGMMAKTFLGRLTSLRRRFRRVIAVDRKPPEPEAQAQYRRLDVKPEVLDVDSSRPRPLTALLERHRGIVLDLTDAPTAFMSRAVFRHGRHSYLNTGFTAGSKHLFESLEAWVKKIPRTTKRPHILFSGMNPGVVNIWAAHGIRKHGLPKELIEFEYDSSALRAAPKRPILTWNPDQYLAEVVEDPSESVGPRGRILHHRPSALFTRRPMKEFLKPFIPDGRIPQGGVTGHEECLTLARRYDVPASYLYALKDSTMRFLVRRAKAGRIPAPDEIALVDNAEGRLLGAEHVGMTLDYGERRVTYFNRVANSDVRPDSATAFQVIVGTYAGLIALASGKIAPGTHFTEDLLDTPYSKFVTDNLVTEELMQEKRGARWRTVSRERLRIGKGPTVMLA